MNKQEAIEQVKNKALHHCGEKECYKDGCEKSIELNTALEIINQIDEPQKVVIPKFVAEWIKYCKDRRSTLYLALTPTKMSKELNEWMALGNNDDIFARAWLYGYEIEPEKLYTVEIPNPKKSYEHVITLKRTIGGDIVIFDTGSNNWKDYVSYQLTEAEIKKDFEWAWNAGFAKEVDNETEK